MVFIEQGQSLEDLAQILNSVRKNATLFNFLTKEKVFVKNQLFATLDTTMRKCFISPKKHFILSDTVGFIKNLPTELVVSFKTTLDEINYSDYFYFFPSDYILSLLLAFL